MTIDPVEEITLEVDPESAAERGPNQWAWLTLTDTDGRELRARLDGVQLRDLVEDLVGLGVLRDFSAYVGGVLMPGDPGVGPPPPLPLPDGE